MEALSDVRIDLTVVDEGGKRMEPAPYGARIGAVSLGKWQVDPIDVPADTFDGHDAHLVKINYTLELEPGAAPMPWFEISFSFPSGQDEKENHVSVVDALPRSGTFADTPKPYVLNRFLNYVPCADNASADVLLPTSADRIDAFGIGGPCVRWRHVSLDGTGVRGGSHAAWLVLLVPAGQTAQDVRFSARYDLETTPETAYRPTQLPSEFRISLTAASDPPGVVTPSLSAPVEDRCAEYHPSAFICYAHDTLRHKYYARQFGSLLARNGVDAHMDQWENDERKHWGYWSHKYIKQDDFVIILASPICRMAFDGQLTGPANPGIRSEAALINEMLHRERDGWTPKVLPVVLPHESVDNIADVLLPGTVDHYEISELTDEGIEELLRAMTGVCRHARPPLGKLPPSVLKPLSGTES